jgi:plasmid stabilization system protein ParE
MAFIVKWSYQASKDQLDILEYWYKRIGTKTYSNKLYYRFKNSIKHISKFPYSGRILEQRNERFFVVEYYLIVYEIYETEIHILRIFDGRRNPADL